jgi:hypothetical protein
MKIPVIHGWYKYRIHNTFGSWFSDTLWAARVLARRLLNKNPEWGHLIICNYDDIVKKYDKDIYSVTLSYKEGVFTERIKLYRDKCHQHSWHDTDDHARHYLTKVYGNRKRSYNLATPHGSVLIWFYDDHMKYTKYWDNEVRFVGL